MKRFFITTLAALLVLFTVGCAAEQPATEEPSATSTEEAESQPKDEPVEEAASDVVAEVNGVQIKLDEYNAMVGLLSQLYMYSTFEDLGNMLTEDQIASFQNDVLSQMIFEEIAAQKAEEMGLAELTESQLAEINATTDAYYEQMMAQFTAEAEAEAEGTTIDVEARAQDLMDEHIESTGFTEEFLTKFYSRSLVLDALYMQVTQDVSVEEADIQAEYDRLLAEQTAQDESDPDQAASDYLYGANAVQVYIPSQIGDIHYVKHVLIELLEEDSAAITAASTEGQDQEALDKLLEDALANIKDTADEVYEKAMDGEDFDTLITEYGADEGMTVEPAKTEGYEVFPGSGMIAEFEEASLALEEVGAISEPVGGQFGYHIIRLESITPQGAIPYEDVSAVVASSLSANLMSEAWTTASEVWEEEAEVVRHLDVIGITQEQIDAALEALGL